MESERKAAAPGLLPPVSGLAASLRGKQRSQATAPAGAIRPQGSAGESAAHERQRARERGANAGATTDNSDRWVDRFSLLRNRRRSQSSQFSRPRFSRRSDGSRRGRDFRSAATPLPIRPEIDESRSRAQRQIRERTRWGGGRENRPRCRQICDPPKSDASPEKSVFRDRACLPKMAALGGGQDFRNLAISWRGEFGRGGPRPNPQPTTEPAERAERTRGRRPRIPIARLTDLRPPQAGASPEPSVFRGRVSLAEMAAL